MEALEARYLRVGRHYFAIQRALRMVGACGSVFLKVLFVVWIRVKANLGEVNLKRGFPEGWGLRSRKSWEIYD
ncbi:MAG: hypothetical protein EBY15_02460 [Gammaproteobacteria bacterium]|nr:hypothetical protein [Gammaproteobacteria bacterium]